MNFHEKLKAITDTDWLEVDFGTSKNKAGYKDQIRRLYQLDFLGNIHKEKDSFHIGKKNATYSTEANGNIYYFVAGVFEKTNDKPNPLKFNQESNISPFAKLVIDYLLGRLVITDSVFYDINAVQVKKLDSFTLAQQYGIKSDISFIWEIMQGIAKTVPVEPVRNIELYKVAGLDFVIDLKTHTLTRTETKTGRSFYKFFEVDYEMAIESKETAKNFLDMVIDGPESLYNATLQPYYMMLVACNLEAKEKFFIAKSGVRTGKGLRHKALSGLFQTANVELDTFLSKTFDGINSWALLSGAEMVLATESGAIQGDRIERVLKTIATEREHVTRQTGGNMTTVRIDGVLCIDTNEIVALSDEMNSRRVLIQYKDRPATETDNERYALFAPFWKAFANADGTPKLEGAIGFLLLALEEFVKYDKRFEWRHLELRNDFELDAFQLEVIHLIELYGYAFLGDEHLKELKKATYGTNRNAYSNALKSIGVISEKRMINKIRSQKYTVGNAERFNMILSSFKEEELKEMDITSLFDDE